MDSPVTDIERSRLRVAPSGLPLMRQRWRRLGFLHWAVDPRALAALVPSALEIDTWKGQAYVGIVPFAIQGSRAPFLPPIPFLSSFNELNLRTYVHRGGRDPGVWFFSLDATSRLAVWGARALYKLPYFHAAIAMERSRRGVVSFSSRRHNDQHRPAFSCSYEPLAAPDVATPGTLEFFLIERYLLYSSDGRYLRSARVWHRPYRFAPARVLDLQQDLAAWADIDFADDFAPIAHYADEVDAHIFAPSQVTEPARRRFVMTTPAHGQIQEAAGS